MLNLLNWADMQTDYDGADVTFDERLEHIAERYGKESIQYINAAIVIEDVKNYENGIIGLDACTVINGKVNCMVIED